MTSSSIITSKNRKLGRESSPSLCYQRSTLGSRRNWRKCLGRYRFKLTLPEETRRSSLMMQIVGKELTVKKSTVTISKSLLLTKRRKWQGEKRIKECFQTDAKVYFERKIDLFKASALHKIWFHDSRSDFMPPTRLEKVMLTSHNSIFYRFWDFLAPDSEWHWLDGSIVNGHVIQWCSNNTYETAIGAYCAAYDSQAHCITNHLCHKLLPAPCVSSK